MPSEEDDDRLRGMERTNDDLLAALRECRDKLNDLERLLKDSGQDNSPPE